MISAADFDDVFACTLSQRGQVAAGRDAAVAAKAGVNVEFGAAPALPAGIEVTEACASTVEIRHPALASRGETIVRRGELVATA